MAFNLVADDGLSYASMQGLNAVRVVLGSWGVCVETTKPTQVMDVLENVRSGTNIRI